MNNVYVPRDTTYNKCYVVQNEGTIRGYDHVPQNNVNYNYRDYYIKSGYIYKEGSGTWSQYTTLPICLDNNIMTNNIMYANNMDIILPIIIILMFIALNTIYSFIKGVFK